MGGDRMWEGVWHGWLSVCITPACFLRSCSLPLRALRRPPDTIKSVMGLSARKCQDNVATLKVLSEEQRELLRNQVRRV